MVVLNQKIPTGTKEWASSNVNLFYGCAHNCRYCYAKKMAIRFKRKTGSNWKQMKLNKKKLLQNYRKRDGRVMFPSSHDIIPEFKEECFLILRKLLESGNSVLITTKPHFNIIKELCLKFLEFQDLIQFRFTITSDNNKLLKFWEESAPSFEERLESLKFTFSLNYKTSVSIEPFLDKSPVSLIQKIYPYVSETIWIGKMNYINRNGFYSNEKKYYDTIRKNYTIKNIQRMIYELKDNYKIRYKDSIKRMNLIVPYYQIPEIKK